MFRLLNDGAPHYALFLLCVGLFNHFSRVGHAVPIVSDSSNIYMVMMVSW